MRRLVASLVLLACLPTAGAAAAAPTLSIGATASKVLYGHSLSLSGTLSSGQAGHRIGIYAEQFGKHGLTWVASVRTATGGHWSYAARPSILTTYEARTGATRSGTVLLAVEPAVEVAQLADGRITARVLAGREFAGRTVELQHPTGAHWTTLETATLGRGSEASFASPIATGRATLRVALSVNQAGAGYLGSRSHALAYRARSVTLVPSTFRVLYRDSLILTGRVSSGQSGQPVSILGLAYGHAAPSTLATVTTGAHGAWSFRAEPGIQTRYSARWSASRSRTLVVGVEPRLGVRLDKGRILVHVSASRPLSGRKVELQEMTAPNRWRTLSELRLDPQENATFPAPIATGEATLRVAISVNEAGAGLLGSIGKAFVYPS